jgi:hypothetical protein
MTGTVLKPEHRDRVFGHHSPGPHRRHEVPGVLAWAANSYLELDGWRHWAMPGGGRRVDHDRQPERLPAQPIRRVSRSPSQRRLGEPSAVRTRGGATREGAERSMAGDANAPPARRRRPDVAVRGGQLGHRQLLKRVRHALPVVHLGLPGAHPVPS